MVVSGLKPSTASSDDLLFKDLCSTHLACDITVIKTTRLGAQKEGKIQPLLVTLTNQDEASTLLSLATSLRSSPDPEVSRHVYINKHLTSAEATAAYEARLLRRSKRQPLQTSPHNHDSSSSQSSASSAVSSEPSTSLTIPGRHREPAAAPSRSDDVTKLRSTTASSSTWQPGNITSPTNCTIPCALTNVLSLKNKLTDLHHLLSTSQYRMIFLTETWLTDDVTDPMIDQNNRYQVFRNDRKAQVGGGVCALIVKSINCTRLSLSETDQAVLIKSKCELLCLDISTASTKFRLILTYRPPNSSFDKHILAVATQSLCDLIYTLFHSHATTLIMGDFNLPYIDWASNAARNDGVHNIMLDCFLNLGISQFVVEPTRLNQLGHGNILDIIMCNDPLFVNISTVKPPLGTSDHCIIDLLLYDVQPDQAGTKLPSSQAQSSKITVPVYNWSAGNYNAINDCLSTIDWHNLFGFHFDADSIWSGFKEIIWPIISLHVPMKMIPHNLKYRPRQYPKKIRVLLCRKAAIWRQLRTNKSQKLKSVYSKVVHECKLAILNFDVCREKSNFGSQQPRGILQICK